MSYKHKWKFNLHKDDDFRYNDENIRPPGEDLSSSSDSVVGSRQINQSNLKLKKAWDTSLGQIKNIFTMGFVIWMTPNQPNLIPLSITIFSLFTPLQAIFNIQKTFSVFEDKKEGHNIILPKIIYVLLNLLSILLVVWKLGKFGLLPTTQADWLHRYSVILPQHQTVGGVL